MFKCNLIVAASLNNVIGVNNALPWKLSADLKYFKEMTINQTVIMGRNTYESIGKALPNRKNFVVTSDKSKINNPEVFVSNSLENAIHTASMFSQSSHVFIIGGGQIYKEALEKKLIHSIYLTRVYTTIEGDTFFPALNLNEWNLVEGLLNSSDEKNEFHYSFDLYTKK